MKPAATGAVACRTRAVLVNSALECTCHSVHRLTGSSTVLANSKLKTQVSIHVQSGSE